VPVAAATAVVGVSFAVVIASQRGADKPAPRVGSPATAGPILGAWRLVAASNGRPIQVPAGPAVTITFLGDDTAVIWTGVNAINLTVRYEPGAVTAQFRLTTAVYDGITDPNHRAILGLLDALAPMAGPPPPVRSTYRIQGERLTIRVGTGTLDFRRDPAGTAPASSPAAAPSTVEPSH